jgi:putative ABC transport system permease protein
VSLGFDRQSVLLTDLNPAGSGYNREQLTVLYRDLLQRIQSIEGVRAATLSAITPLSGAGWSRFITVEGFRENPADRRYLALNAVGPRYFETYRTPLLAGRDFQFEDEGRARVAIVNRAMSRYYFGDASPIGRRFRIEGDDRPYEIVGLVDNAKYDQVHDAPPRSIYLNAFQDGRIASLFAIRTDRSPLSIAGAVQQLIHDAVPRVKIAKVTTLAAHVDESVVQERVLAAVSGLFGVLGCVLAAIGLYGLLAYTVARRVHEIGIRMALGATRRDVVAMVVKSALALVAAGVCVGVPAALLGTRVAVSRMQGLAVSGSLPTALAAVLMIGVALLAALLPARRAARIEPSEALRMD